ncbi:hypothetical protein BD311DRAFT_234286 [Dichomitus squalens]|uniref:Uncharacterized protein n=1 Tax=Dichomitus squalens TaxID=114155 RepID=A0A4Q9MSZ4_9APHY|nr:hypothetical protein BD311DRAFT_234286 [Dichomitus squalens]
MPMTVLPIARADIRVSQVLMRMVKVGSDSRIYSSPRSLYGSLRTSATPAARSADATQSADNPTLSHAYTILTVVLVLIAVAVIVGVGWVRVRNRDCVTPVYRQIVEPKMWEAHLDHGTGGTTALGRHQNKSSGTWSRIMPVSVQTYSHASLGINTKYDPIHPSASPSSFRRNSSRWQVFRQGRKLSPSGSCASSRPFRETSATTRVAVLVTMPAPRRAVQETTGRSASPPPLCLGLIDLS